MEELEKQSWTKATILSFIQHDLLLSWNTNIDKSRVKGCNKAKW